MESHEYILPEDQGIDFVNELLLIADDIRGGNDALILILNLRFTLASRALLAMQQFDRSFYVEIWTVKGMDGNAAFHSRMKAKAEEFGGIPHWGHYHNHTRDFRALYNVIDAHSGRMRDKLRIWSLQMGILHTGGGSDRPNTFRHDFALDRGLLTEL